MDKRSATGKRGRAFLAGVARMQDANVNRAREGVRVAEDIARYVLDDQKRAGRLKTIRHRMTETASASSTAAIGARDAMEDTGRRAKETASRQGIDALVHANLRRAQEACRVLEETSRLRRDGRREAWKRLRYDLYEEESDLIAAISGKSGKPERRA